MTNDTQDDGAGTIADYMPPSLAYPYPCVVYGRNGRRAYAARCIGHQVDALHVKTYRVECDDGSVVAVRDGLLRGVGTRADALTRAHTAFDSFADLLRGSHNGTRTAYRPTLTCRVPQVRELADHYDKAQEIAGDRRRAYRG